MVPIHCPHCHKLLCKANFAYIEIKCKCGRIVKVKLYTQSALLLTPESEADKIIAIEQRSLEVIEPDHKEKPVKA